MILFDAHVHIYQLFELDVLIESAFRNFQVAIGKLGEQEKDCQCFLLLAEAGELNYFSELQHRASLEDSPHRWRLVKTQEACAVGVVHPDYADLSLTIVAGRQLITTERLELLALITDESFADNMPLDAAVQRVLEKGGLPVCAWGAGKWTGRRGEFLSEFLGSSLGASMFLGDSGGRPVLWPASKLMGKTGFRDKILSGTDPLPLKGEEKRVGSYGGYIAGSCPETVSAMDLRDVLLESGKTILPFGKSLDPFLFVKNQLGLRLRR